MKPQLLIHMRGGVVNKMGQSIKIGINKTTMYKRKYIFPVDYLIEYQPFIHQVKKKFIFTAEVDMKYDHYILTIFSEDIIPDKLHIKDVNGNEAILETPYYYD